MSNQRDTAHTLDIHLGPMSLDYLAEDRQYPTQTSMVILGNVSIAAAMLYYKGNDVHAEIYLPKTVDLTPPCPGSIRVIGQVPLQQLLLDQAGSRLIEGGVYSGVEAIRVVASGDADY